MDKSLISEYSTQVMLLNNKGVEFLGKRDLLGAFHHFLAAYTLDNTSVISLQNLSAIYLNTERFSAARLLCLKALELEPDNKFVKFNLATALLGMRLVKESLEVNKNNTSEMETEASFLHNYGLALSLNEQFNEALEMFNKSLELNPNSASVHSDRGLTRLAVKDIQGGLEEYEIRWGSLFRGRTWEYVENNNIPQWKGENLAGKKILIHHEQGFGDTLMLMRFITNLLVQGAKVFIAVPVALVRLVAKVYEHDNVIVFDWESDQGNDPVKELTYPSEVKGADYHCPMLSLMRWLGVEVGTIPDNSYIKYESSTRKTDKSNSKLKIGICWASGDHGIALARRRRIVPLDYFFPLLEIPEVELISLQLGSGRELLEAVSIQGLSPLIKDPMSMVADFLDTANIIKDLDLVISVDSAVVHLAGGMGKPVIMLGPNPRCWRWWGKTTGEPWYKNFKIFQQDQSGDWRNTMIEIVSHVKETYFAKDYSGAK